MEEQRTAFRIVAQNLGVEWMRARLADHQVGDVVALTGEQLAAILRAPDAQGILAEVDVRRVMAFDAPTPEPVAALRQKNAS
jgi:hypothetical protein